ncbi:hypothetical protein AWZ03_014079 [Drosophila navojoa]|uniref:Nucleoplasmin-like domain-containing protein n=1 Tax=Drosophila navojoa TaxID=7232 RepID=A0A484AV61_DRONA|nr:hypothetical protein AWZ03_014079 [Drosophila navojoa]
MADDSSLYFYGLTIRPKRKYTQQVTSSLHISQVALASGVCSILYLKINHRKFAVATLSSAIPQAPLDLNFNDGDRLHFYAVGNGRLSILGYALAVQSPASHVRHTQRMFLNDEDSGDSVDSDRGLTDSYIDISEDNGDSRNTQNALEVDRSTMTGGNKASTAVDTVYELSSDTERPGGSSVHTEELPSTPATEDSDPHTSPGLHIVHDRIECYNTNIRVVHEYLCVNVHGIGNRNIHETYNNADESADEIAIDNAIENVANAEQKDNDDNNADELSAASDANQSPSAKRARLSNASDGEE